MSLTVKQLKSKLPLADVTELRDGVRYVFRLPPYSSKDVMERAAKFLHREGINALVIDHDIEVLEILDV